MKSPCFVHTFLYNIFPSDYYKVLNTFGVVRYITFEGKAVPVPPQQILAIKQYINAEEILPEGVRDFEAGDKVEIFRGPLKGLSGNLIRVQGKQKVKIEIESIGHSITLTIPQSYLRIIEPVKKDKNFVKKF